MTKKTIVINYILIALLFVSNIFASVYFLSNDKTDLIFEENILKVVEIKVSSNNEESWGYATGLFIDSKGTILTNKHVVYDAIKAVNHSIIRVRIANVEEWIDAEILEVSEFYDLAKIKINKNDTKYFDITEVLNNGDTVYTIGNPNGFGLSFTTGVVSSKLRNVIHNEQTIPAIQTSFVINEGNSGGPVFNKHGKLVGIISFRLRDKQGDVIHGVSFALPIKTINDFLKN